LEVMDLVITTSTLLSHIQAGIIPPGVMITSMVDLDTADMVTDMVVMVTEVIPDMEDTVDTVVMDIIITVTVIPITMKRIDVRLTPFHQVVAWVIPIVQRKR